MFLRGVDSDGTRDSEGAQRGPVRPGGNSGISVGSVQADEFKAHKHTMSSWTHSFNDPATNNSPAYGGAFSEIKIETSTEGGYETRPKNAYVYFIIKADS